MFRTVGNLLVRVLCVHPHAGAPSREWRACLRGGVGACDPKTASGQCEEVKIHVAIAEVAFLLPGGARAAPFNTDRFARLG